VTDKRAYLARCKFTIAFENESSLGYATEKILEPLLMGSIPIYWGDPAIEEDFNPACLINAHRFPDFESLINYVLEVDRNESLWRNYVTAPIFRNNCLPECLSNEAFCAFIDRAADSGPQISAAVRFKQRCKKRLANASNAFGSAGRRFVGFVKRLVRRAIHGQNGYS
jgi:hypothetical protein